MPPTMRRVLLDERDIVLADALKRAPGERVVGVVGKAHVAGIAAAWEEDTLTRLAAALEEPAVPIGPYVGLVGSGIAVGWGVLRSRAVRYGVGASVIAAGGAAAWFVNALRDRLEFYERTQRELQRKKH